MDDELKQIPEYMLGLGLGALAHANRHTHYSDYWNQWWNELGVLQAAHAAEILIKARIAQEHPLLIFDSLPRYTESNPQLLNLRQLVESARTVQFADLPQLLWAACGIHLPDIERYRAFGRLRNSIQHFMPPQGLDVAGETSAFIYGVVDPFINNCWGLCAIDYDEDDDPYTYLLEPLVRRELLFFVSANALEHVEFDQFEWPENEDYRQEMKQRFEKAAGTAPSV